MLNVEILPACNRGVHVFLVLVFPVVVKGSLFCEELRGGTILDILVVNACCRGGGCLLSSLSLQRGDAFYPLVVLLVPAQGS